MPPNGTHGAAPQYAPVAPSAGAGAGVTHHAFQLGQNGNYPPAVANVPGLVYDGPGPPPTAAAPPPQYPPALPLYYQPFPSNPLPGAADPYAPPMLHPGYLQQPHGAGFATGSAQVPTFSVAKKRVAEDLGERNAKRTKPQMHCQASMKVSYQCLIAWRSFLQASGNIVRQRNVLELCPPGHPLRPGALDKLSRSLLTRFQRRCSIDDVDECIQFGREAVSLFKGHSGCDDYLNNLAISLLFRFFHQHNPNNLDDAISFLEEALRLLPFWHQYRDSSLDNIGGAFITRFAISLRREALTLRPPGHPRRGTTLTNLAVALKARYDRLDVSEDLNEAIDMYRESLRMTIHSVTKLSRRKIIVEEAITLCQELLAALSSLHPEGYFSYMRLQKAYLSRYQVLHNPADLSLAMENFRLASRHPTRGIPQRIIEAIDWAHQAEVYQHESALEAYQMYFELFDTHMMTRSSVISRCEAATAFRGAQSLSVDVRTYQSGRDVVRIASFTTKLTVIASKQRPRRLSLKGSDGQDYQYGLKGHEDLRQDERVMQLYGLVNTLCLLTPIASSDA
ncbi:hypothetical protein BDR05DRAFT_943283 [Suillus weaverae]|nr:hypothetical protein BDR05DRAFT_943283 [Suillus weaverae]